MPDREIDPHGTAPDPETWESPAFFEALARQDARQVRNDHLRRLEAAGASKTHIQAEALRFAFAPGLTAQRVLGGR